MEEYQRAKHRVNKWRSIFRHRESYFTEQALQYNVNSLNEDQKTIFYKIVKDVNDGLSQYVKNTTFADSISFRYLLSSYKDHISVIYGSAGTGKSFLTAELIKFLLSTNLRITATAPTHKAVSVIQEKTTSVISCVFNPPEFRTLHSFLELEVSNDYNTGTVYTKRRNDDKIINPWTDILIVDESSMVNSELFEIIVEKLKRGDLAYVIFIGDPNQLPPVNDESFSINTYIDPSKQYRLNTIVRQAKHNPIIEVSQEVIKYITREKSGRLNLIKYIKSSKLPIVQDEYELLKHCIEDDNSILISYTNNKVNARNLVIREYKIPGAQEAEFIAGESVILQESYTNRLGNRFFNNQEFKIKSVELRFGGQDSDPLTKKLFYYRLYQDIKGVTEKNTMYIDVISENSKMLYNKLIKELASQANYQTNKEKRKNLWRIYFRLKDRFCAVQYPYAMTIHKSQGSTFDNVYVDMTGTSFVPDETYYRLLYVAITRAANKAYLLF